VSITPRESRGIPRLDVADRAAAQWAARPNTLTATAAHLEITQGGSPILCRNSRLAAPAIRIAC
jgi:hypothetical protein